MLKFLIPTALVLSVIVAALVLFNLGLLPFPIDPALALQHPEVPVPPVVTEPSLPQRIGSIIGVSGATLAIIFIVARQLAEILAKLIPDTALGFTGMIRKVAKLISGYVPNKA